MAKVYLTLILNDRKKFSQVPPSMVEPVKGLLQEMVDDKKMTKTEMKSILAA